MIRRLIILLLIVGCVTEPEDCAGVAGGNSYLDECGGCDGDNSTCTDDNTLNSYQLEDLNSSSSSFGETLSHNTFSGKVILYYFPLSDTWSLCKNRFDSLNELFLEYGGDNGDIKIIGVGKNDGNTIYTVAEDTVLPYVKETDDYNLRNELGVVDRDVYFYNTIGTFIEKINLTSEFNKMQIESIINGILNEIP